MRYSGVAGDSHSAAPCSTDIAQAATQVRGLSKPCEEGQQTLTAV